MAHWYSYFAVLLGVVTATSGLADDDGVVITPKQQKEAFNATAKPSRGELPWGKINFIHTTDTHGWLEGHMNERNYGGDWGDFVSFVNRMRGKADDLLVDLLVVDTGDLHDGNGLSDITNPKGGVSDSIFANIEYDLLTIGNHEVQKLEEARNIKENISQIYGDRYLTSNVYIHAYGEKEESIGVPYRYFTTKHNTRVMAFGILFDDGKNDPNITIDNAKQMMARPWFADAMAKDVDLYVLLGHGSLRNSTKGPTENGAFLDFQYALRAHLTEEGKDIPIQILGGHTHIRDFRCFDERTSGLQSGKYGDTVGWLALDQFKIKGWRGAKELKNIVTPQRSCAGKKQSGVPLLDRRYLDWNVLTFTYHSMGPNETDTSKFDTPLGRKVTHDIKFARNALNLTFYLGCANETWCLWCNETKGNRNIMELAKPAALETVVSDSRSDRNRAVILTGTSFRYDIFQGPFTLGDALAIVPFTDQFYYVEVNYTTYQNVRKFGLKVSDIYPPGKKHSPVLLSEKDSSQNVLSLRAADEPVLTPGYNTTDDFGNNGDDTTHSEFIEMGPNLPKVALQSWNDPRPPADFKLDLVVSSHSEPIVRKYLNLTEPLLLYMRDFTTADILPEYARRHWNDNPLGDKCPVAPRGS